MDLFHALRGTSELSFWSDLLRENEITFIAIKCSVPRQAYLQQNLHAVLANLDFLLIIHFQSFGNISEAVLRTASIKVSSLSSKLLFQIYRKLIKLKVIRRVL